MSARELAGDLGLFTLRVVPGLAMAIAHGLPKAQKYAEKASTFADPLGVGPQVSMTLAVFSELVCALAVAAGLATRFCASQVAITMIVAAFVVHADDPFARKELALIYGLAFLALVLTGPGRFSLDHLIAKRWRKRG